MIDIKQKANDYGPLPLPVIVHYFSSPKILPILLFGLWTLAFERSRVASVSNTNAESKLE
jgi:hypothetical protein